MEASTASQCYRSSSSVSRDGVARKYTPCALVLEGKEVSNVGIATATITKTTMITTKHHSGAPPIISTTNTQEDENPQIHGWPSGDNR